MDLLNDQNFLQSLAKKVEEDATFKKNLFDNPLKTIESFSGHRIILTQGKEMKIIDQSDPSTVFINLPAVRRSMDDAELNEEQLDIVSGGNGDPKIVI